ncbi:3TM-type holin [Pseudoalteromonas denitrificans]|uniref:Holin of 3TMs, for gene-transfer release n=1 Tax=Pseudoalteromonas denitrificans DSM 6059 TaxID=1123010 RepID=A0A1I1PWA9_9GAMM|nr:3TM-type holin [Pseudoalteromonas denitrificans]SFD14007.1 Holin of 3TMs, for gene-transfer release [Pseudoalteromonas denitrificans DSM 6059]
MSWLKSIFSTQITEPINAVGGILDEIFTSDEEELNLALIKQRLKQQPNLVQAEINKVQAKHRSIFVAGARPFLMWVCGFGFLFAFIVNPILQWLFPEVGAPELPLNTMMELTLGMLGLAGLRTIEKIKGVSK